MCAVSYVGDYWRRDFPQRHPQWYETVTLPNTQVPQVPQVSKQEFDALKREIEELKKLLQAAKKYDDAMGEPDCEMDDKVALVKKIAKAVGVDMGDVFGKGNSEQE